MQSMLRADRVVARPHLSDYCGPTGFHWIDPGHIATTPMPGVTHPVDADLADLRHVGVSHLLSLTDDPLSASALDRHGLAATHLPIYDREVPTVTQMKMLCIVIGRLLDGGHVLAIHCHAGLGRTGTVAACWLINEGMTAAAALRHLRRIDSQYVQTRMQEDFLDAFEQAVQLPD